MNDSILEERCTDGILVCSWTNRIKSKGSLWIRRILPLKYE
jgi:hypothetical protein